MTESSFIAPDAWIIGKTTLKAHTSVFFGAVLRGDIFEIKVGDRTNIQEHALLHTSNGLGPCTVGDEVTVGHRAIIHGAIVGSRCIIGMGATILDGAEISEDSIVGANSLVTMNKKFPPRSMIMGSPAKAVRELTDEEVKSITDSAQHYVEKGAWYLSYFLKII